MTFLFQRKIEKTKEEEEEEEEAVSSDGNEHKWQRIPIRSLPLWKKKKKNPPYELSVFT